MAFFELRHFRGPINVEKIPRNTHCYFISVLDEECSDSVLGQETLPPARCQAGLMCIEGHCKEYSNVVEVTEVIIV